ncbi:transporter substrate-binding domain-containing protein [Pseudomonas sp. SA3-5]|uniref:Transporter substrate-binding domain-containing protein n=1 Tax=Pseudomonas aestuarii TaxID=3018340 RepID=A0ABT4XD32_9PSED|nr:transporter substrate-binding domain-containing protein [Pseudomonas aestuarii]MDA7086125.1 transporter substrate-binding domain-containing protein [Pseudomonas aestuarii]
MRCLSLTLILLSLGITAEERPLRFAVSESWAMPLIHIEHGQAIGGIIHDLQQRLAERVGRRAEMLVRPRPRIQQMLVRGEVDVRCYVNPAWLSESHHQYIWSVPFMVQRDLLVGRSHQQVQVSRMQGETIGTVLGFTYPELEPLFASGHLRRDNARTQTLALDKLKARRYDYAISNELSLQWFNRQQPAGHKLQPLLEVSADIVACIVRDEPDVPTMAVLRALVQMSQAGEFETILSRYR